MLHKSLLRGGAIACGWISALLFLTALVSGTSLAAPANSGSPPNIVVIVADDLGYGEIVRPGGPVTQSIPTPRIDSLAAGGTHFTNGYVTCPVCSPTRAGLLTGRYQQRFGFEFNPGPPQSAAAVFGLPLDQITLADRMKKLGYATGAVGKWHLGYKPAFFPTRRGFDDFFGFLAGAHAYLDGKDRDNPIWNNDKIVDEKLYLTDALGRQAVDFINQHHERPFLLYLAFNAVHAPMQATAKYRDRFPTITDENRRTFAGMLAAMDDNIGLVLDRLAQDRLDERTLIFFIADNGGPTAQTTSRNDPLRGFKSQVWEGGIRVPFRVQWKGHLPAGKIFDAPVSSLDIVPTALAAAGHAPEVDATLDGVNLLPYLEGDRTGRPHETLYWRYSPQWAIRQGDYKLLQPPDGPVQLFNLAQDVGEQHDLSQKQPEVAKRLKEAFDAWDAELKPPLWKRQGKPRARAGKAE